MHRHEQSRPSDANQKANFFTGTLTVLGLPPPQVALEYVTLELPSPVCVVLFEERDLKNSTHGVLSHYSAATVGTRCFNAGRVDAQSHSVASDWMDSESLDRALWADDLLANLVAHRALIRPRARFSQSTSPPPPPRKREGSTARTPATPTPSSKCTPAGEKRAS